MNSTKNTRPIDWVTGDYSGLKIPARREALLDGGVEFLTLALQSSGALSENNRVTQIIQLTECPGGSTGRKAFLSVRYESPSESLHESLFVKFSRDFDNKIRDRAKGQLEAEVRLALLSSDPAFPITVPQCYFADYHHESGTGILITQSISFGNNGIEPLYEKCLDYEIPQAIDHYRAIIRALARLAGAHKSGALDSKVNQHFPLNLDSQAINQPIPYDQRQLQRRIDRFSEFAQQQPQLIPENIRRPEFIRQFSQDIPLLLQREKDIKRALSSKPHYIAMAHWNANIDNAWFWRNQHGALECGLMDWGNVAQMNLALALWGALSAAEIELWNRHFDELLNLFVEEYQLWGGPPLDSHELKHQVFLCVAVMGVAWLMDAPAMIRAEAPCLHGLEDRYHPTIRNNETARTQLQMLCNVLNLWQRHRFGDLFKNYKV
jgi:hypothetical protein